MEPFFFFLLYISNLYEGFEGMRLFDMHEKKEIAATCLREGLQRTFRTSHIIHIGRHIVSIHVQAKRTIKMWFKLMSKYTVICACRNKIAHAHTMLSYN